MNVRFSLISNGSDKIIRVGFALTFIFTAISFFYVLIRFSKLPPLIPLFNQMPWGEQRLGTREQIFIPVAISFAVLIANFFFSQTTYNKSPLISRILCVTSTFISFFTLIFIVKTIHLII